MQTDRNRATIAKEVLARDIPEKSVVDPATSMRARTIPHGSHIAARFACLFFIIHPKRLRWLSMCEFVLEDGGAFLCMLLGIALHHRASE